MRSAKSVIPECNIDSNLFDVLLNFEKESVNHAKGNGTVVTKMKYKFANSSCVGIIDKDRRDLKQIKIDFSKIEIEGTENYFILYQGIEQKHHYLIQMVPAIEKWICNVVNELGIRLIEFNINASNSKELKKVTEKVDSKKDPRFKALFKEIVKRSYLEKFLPVLKLKEIINLILREEYFIDINKLKNI